MLGLVGAKHLPTRVVDDLRRFTWDDGVFKVALLSLFDLPLERFWMWSMDLCGISIIELRAGRPVLRAHNSTAHLAELLDEATQQELEERSRAGAL